LELIVPTEAAQLVAPADVNCCVAPSVTDAEAGEIVCSGINVIAADTEPPGPVAVTVTAEEDGIVDGAV
jgi:hypothetical protein